jgi:7-carboxy-7-deazaguanine synthase (Cx14CxxC type)
VTYAVKELFFTLQGEGAHAGRTAVFCRFAGCNLWSGREADRATADCDFCDTDFVGTDGPGGDVFRDAESLAEAITACWRRNVTEGGVPFVVFTGGEPALQLDAGLVEACHQQDFEIAIETNGTLPLPASIDWVCVSPKPGPALRQTTGDELKFVYPQEELRPEDYIELGFERFSLQPMDGPKQQANIEAATAYCLRNPRWRLSLQTHKMIGIP